MLRIVFSRFRKHAFLHLFVPLLVGIAIEAVVVALQRKAAGVTTPWLHLFLDDIIEFRTLALILGVFLSYLVIMSILIRKEVVTNENYSHLARLQDTLDDAKAYFAFSIIPLEEWFHPAMQVYLAKLLNRKLAHNGFEHERTLLFFSKAELQNAQRLLMDEYFNGVCLAHQHNDCQIPLSYLGRREIFSLLTKLSPEEREQLGCYPRWSRWRPFRVFRRFPLRWARRRIPALGFALVKKGDGSRSILRIAKHGSYVRIVEEIEGEQAKPYERFVELVRNVIYRSPAHKLDANHNFLTIYDIKPALNVQANLGNARGTPVGHPTG